MPLPSLHDCDMKITNFTRLLYGVGEHNAKIFLFLFLNLDKVLSDSTPPPKKKIIIIKISPTLLDK